MAQEGFYKKQIGTDGEGNEVVTWLYGTTVTNANYNLKIGEQDQHTFPVDGWEYQADASQEYLDWKAALENA